MIWCLKNSFKKIFCCKENILKSIPSGSIPLVQVHYCCGRKILRSRINEKNETFERVMDLTYPPAQYAKLNRLSADGEPMFYGSLFSRSSAANNCYPRIVNILEICDPFRRMDVDGSIMTTVGNWVTNRDLRLLAFPLASYSRSFAESRDIRAQYDKIKGYYTKESRNFAKYIGCLLSRERRPCLYEITSVVAHYVLYDDPNTNSFDGVLYPSVKTAGEGLNVCLKPNVADEALTFLGARKQELVKHGEKVTIVDVADAKADNDGNLVWKPVIRDALQ